MIFLKKNQKVDSTNYAYDHKNHQIIKLKDLYDHEIIVNGIVLERIKEDDFSHKKMKSSQANFKKQKNINKNKVKK